MKLSDDKDGCLVCMVWFLVLGCLVVTCVLAVFVAGPVPKGGSWSELRLAQFVTGQGGLVLACIGCVKGGGSERRKWVGCVMVAILAISWLAVYFAMGCAEVRTVGVAMTTLPATHSVAHANH